MSTLLLRAKLERRIQNERKRAEALYAKADAQTDIVGKLETILDVGDESDWRAALGAFVVR